MEKEISVCIVCMNRIQHLQSTLKKNLETGSRFPNLEFVLLNYNSQDGLDDWIKSNFKDEIKQSRLIYYHTTIPQIFSHSHSKNLAFKLSSGKIICNLNADHFLGEGFIEFVLECFEKNSDIVLTPHNIQDKDDSYLMPHDVGGKVCLSRESFYAVSGFDENMSIYGFEDIDFIHRLFLSGKTIKLIDNLSFLSYLNHSDEIRHSTSELQKNLRDIYVCHLNFYNSVILILFNDLKCSFFSLIDETLKESMFIRNSFEDRQLHTIVCYDYSGTDSLWSESNTAFVVSEGSKKTLRFIKKSANQLEHKKRIFNRIHSEEIKAQILSFRDVYNNRTIFLGNQKNGIIKVNDLGFGKGTVYKNFDYTSEITVN